MFPKSIVDSFKPFLKSSQISRVFAWERIIGMYPKSIVDSFKDEGNRYNFRGSLQKKRPQLLYKEQNTKEIQTNECLEKQRWLLDGQSCQHYSIQGESLRMPNCSVCKVCR